MDGSAYIRAGVPMKTERIAVAPLQKRRKRREAERLGGISPQPSLFYQERTRICDRHENFARKRKIGT